MRLRKLIRNWSTVPVIYCFAKMSLSLLMVIAMFTPSDFCNTSITRIAAFSFWATILIEAKYGEMNFYK